MSESQPNIRINKIEIKNYKGIEHVNIEFPLPVMDYDPDIMVIGSKNGLGKTSILECCVLLLICLNEKNGLYNIHNRKIGSSINVTDLLIHGGQDETVISGDIEYTKILNTDKPITEAKIINITVSIQRKGTILISGIPPLNNQRRFDDEQYEMHRDERINDINHDFYKFLRIICGLNQNPLITENCLFFHSFRRVIEGNPELRHMITDESPESLAFFRPKTQISRISSFKVTILSMMMGQAKLFESESELSGGDESMNVLNNLMETYANAKISKLRPSPKDNTIDIRIGPLNGEESYSFDGLSSGQKEIISTLFMIWNNTYQKPAVVLIDEPELHLNAGWHRIFVKKLFELAPKNQYI